MDDRGIESTFRALEQLRASNKKLGLLIKEEYFNVIDELKVAASRRINRRQCYSTTFLSDMQFYNGMILRS